MSTHLSRLRRQCQPVQEDTPVPSREHRISVDKRDLLQLLADYDTLSIINQCDGCRVGAPYTSTGNHQMPDGGFMGCTRDKYHP